MNKRMLQAGQIFERLTVVKFINKNKGYECRCTCGATVYARSDTLKSGRNKSCGCYIAEYHRRRGEQNQNLIFGFYKRNAKLRNVEFALTKEQFNTLIQQECFYCRSTPSTEHRVYRKDGRIKTLLYNGIDRVNNKLGYIDGNIVTCCKICNKSKSDMTLSEWKEWLKRISSNQHTF